MFSSLFRWAGLAFAGTVFTVLAVLITPILPFLVRDNGYLPDWLSWFQTPDNPAFGDRQFHGTQMSWTRSKYLWTVFWLWRNPAYGFDFTVLGMPVLPGFVVKRWGDDMTSNSPLHNGWVFRRLIIGCESYWQFYLVHAWTETKCLRINLGWKLWGDLQIGQVRPLVISFNPWIACISGGKNAR